MNRTSSAVEIRKELLYGDGPLVDWEGAAGVVRSFVFAVCSAAADVDLNREETLRLLLRRLGELKERADKAAAWLERRPGPVDLTPGRLEAELVGGDEALVHRDSATSPVVDFLNGIARSACAAEITPEEALVVLRRRSRELAEAAGLALATVAGLDAN
ncbi:MAG: hypothetical protein M1522_05110 [Actinobacteria bacterium]|jgi:hypothetical protein|nr:hypothetical protein [Actinomycetota bacterium]